MGRSQVIEGKFEGFYTNPTQTYGRTHTISFPGPPPYTMTHVSVSTWVGQALEQIGFGKQVKITVEEVGDAG